MKISRSTGYALLAVGYIAQNQDEKTILSQTIAKKYDISLEYLLKILQQLVKANVLRSKRGPRGGFTLAKPIKKISMLEIIEAIEGRISNVLNLTDYAPKEKFAIKVDQTYDKALNLVKGVFDKTKVADMI